MPRRSAPWVESSTSGIWRLAGHLDDLAKGLTRTVEAYNRTVGTIETRVLVTARRFKELGVSAAEPIPEVATVERTPRPLQAPEMAGPVRRTGRIRGRR